MMANRRSVKFLSQIGWILLLVVCAFIATTSMAFAELPIRPQPGLPNRPATPQPPSQNEVGARIMLQATHWNASTSTIVRWIDGEGLLHDVVGWRGDFQSTGYVRWFVEEKDFGQGPFIWQIIQSSTGEVLWSSPAFYLPTQPNELVLITAEPSDAYVLPSIN